MFTDGLRNVLSKGIVSPLKREAQYYGVKPRVGTLFLTFRCTSRCKTCTAWKRNALKEREIGLEEWCRITDTLYGHGVRCMELFGGDIFLRKDLSIALIKHLKKKDACVLHIPTNSNLVDEEVAMSLAQEEVDYLYFSVDGVSDVQDTVRGIEGSFSNVIRAVELVRRFRKSRSRPQLICNTTVSNLNVTELPNIAAFALEAGFDQSYYEYVGEMTPEQIEKSAIDGLTPTPFYVREGESVLLDKDQAIELKRVVQEIKRRYAKTKLSVSTVNIDALSVRDLYEGTIPNKKCYVVRTEVTVDPYGNVVACPIINNYVFGNVVEQDFGDIWNNSKHKHFRRYRDSGRICLCRHCILGVQRNRSLLASWKRKLFTT